MSVIDEISTLNMIRQQKCRRLGHLFTIDVLLQEIIEGRMKGKALWEERDYIFWVISHHQQSILEVKMAAEDQEGQSAINRTGMQ